MKNNFKKIISKPIFVYSIAVFIVIISSIIIFSINNKNIATLSAVVKLGTITDTISLTGQVKASEGVDLSFERSGKIANHYVSSGNKVYTGQQLVSLENADLLAQVHQAEANLKIAQAKLDQMNIGAKEEDLSIAESNLSGAKISLSQAQNSLIEKIRDAYAKADDAIRNQTDPLFLNPKSSTPKLIFSTDFQLKNDLESGRITIETILESWSTSIATIDKNSEFSKYNDDATNNLTSISKFLNEIAYAVNGMTPTASISQANISTWKLNISGARTSIDIAITSLNTAYQNYNSSEVALNTAANKLTLTQKGATKEEIAAQEGQLESARASLESANASLEKSIIRAPFSGLIAKDDVIIGATVSAGSPLITIISESRSEVTVNISEADISRIEIGDLAKVTLDAYGNSTEFDAKIVSIDSSERIVDGVAVYQAKLDFIKPDAKIKDGMTANISVSSNTHDNALVIPFRAILQKNNTYTVLVDNGSKTPELRNVEIGIKGNDGLVEIISGLKEGEKILVY